jgi:hypothetical protein
MLSAVWDDGDDAHGWPRPTARWQGGCYCRCKAQRLLSPHALILILILISLAAPQAPTASTDPQHRHPCRRFLVACPLLQLRLQVQLPACARQAPVLFPPSPHLTLTSPHPHLAPHIVLARPVHRLQLSAMIASQCHCLGTQARSCIVRRAPCDFLLRRPAACSCLPPLQPFHASLAPARCVPPATLSHTLCKGPFALRRRAAVTNHRARTVAACEPRYCPARPHIPHFHACPTSLTSTHAPYPSLPHMPHISPPASAHT